jgi:hypothetical protein
MQTPIVGVTSLGRGGLPAGAGIGYAYDWLRQRQRKADEQRKKSKKLKKKIKKLTKRRKKEKRRDEKQTIESTKKRLDEEEGHRERIK